jgi:hypothetical protein
MQARFVHIYLRGLSPTFLELKTEIPTSQLLRTMSGPTSRPLALVVLILLPFDIATWILRFYVRLSRRAWGPDDWSMLAAIVRYLLFLMARDLYWYSPSSQSRR